MRAIAFAVSLPIHLYRWLISPLLPASCRFTPTCSAYALEAIGRFGPITGTLLAARRLLRCHPWGACGVDPVPAHSPFARAVKHPGLE
jgi:putative membrane protein insertion efficiency factor